MLISIIYFFKRFNIIDEMGVKILQGETKLGGGKKLQEVKTSSLFIYLFILKNMAGLFNLSTFYL